MTEIYENLSSYQENQAMVLTEGDYLTDNNDNVIDVSDDSDGWADDFAESDDDITEEYYGNITHQSNLNESEVTEEGFYDLPQDEHNAPPPPDIVRSLKPVAKRQPPQPKTKPNVKQKPRVCSYDNHKLKIPPPSSVKKNSSESKNIAESEKMLNPFARKSKFLEHLHKPNNKPPTVANKRQTLSISPPKPHIVCGQPYLPPHEDFCEDELVYQVEQEIANDENNFYIDPSEDPTISTCPVPTRTLPSTPDAMSGQVFLRRLDTFKKQNQIPYNNAREEGVVEVIAESDYEVCNSTATNMTNDSSKSSSKESSGDSCNINIRLTKLTTQSEDIIESDQYEILGETQNNQQNKCDTGVPTNIRNRPPLPTPKGEPLSAPKLPRTSPVVKRSAMNKPVEEIQEEYEYVPTEMTPIFPAASPSADLPQEDTHYEPAEAKSIFKSNKTNERKESSTYISPITCHTEYRPFIPERQKNPVKLTDKPACPPRKAVSSDPEAENSAHPQKTGNTPPSPPAPYEKYDPKARPNTKVQNKPDVDRSRRPVPALPDRNPLHSDEAQPPQVNRTPERTTPPIERRPLKPTPIGRREIPLPELPQCQDRKIRDGHSLDSVPPRPVPMGRKEMPLPETPQCMERPSSDKRLLQKKLSISTNLNDFSWYHPYMNINDAKQKLLRGAKEGDFIIRRSQNSADNYSISIFTNGKITHLKVPFVEGSYRLGTSPQKFQSVPELIRFYQNTRVILTSGGSVLLRS